MKDMIAAAAIVAILGMFLWAASLDERDKRDDRVQRLQDMMAVCHSMDRLFVVKTLVPEIQTECRGK